MIIDYWLEWHTERKNINLDIQHYSGFLKDLNPCKNIYLNKIATLYGFRHKLSFESLIEVKSEYKVVNKAYQTNKNCRHKYVFNLFHVYLIDWYFNLLTLKLNFKLIYYCNFIHLKCLLKNKWVAYVMNMLYSKKIKRSELKKCKSMSCEEMGHE